MQVIQRKLVNVLTPSTLIHGNIGAQAVHLLALKEVYYLNKNFTLFQSLLRYEGGVWIFDLELVM